MTPYDVNGPRLRLEAWKPNIPPNDRPEQGRNQQEFR